MPSALGKLDVQLLAGRAPPRDVRVASQPEGGARHAVGAETDRPPADALRPAWSGRRSVRCRARKSTRTGGAPRGQLDDRQPVLGAFAGRPDGTATERPSGGRRPRNRRGGRISDHDAVVELAWAHDSVGHGSPEQLQDADDAARPGGRSGVRTASTALETRGRRSRSRTESDQRRRQERWLSSPRRPTTDTRSRRISHAPRIRGRRKDGPDERRGRVAPVGTTPTFTRTRPAASPTGVEVQAIRACRTRPAGHS